MTKIIHVNQSCIEQLDIAPARIPLDKIIEERSLSDTIRFEILFPREPGDPRELSEIAEIRLWFVRLDASYPWLPYLLDWREGELTRYAAMLVPHEFKKDGDGYRIEFNPEALQIFVMQKLFQVFLWLRSLGIEDTVKLQQMSQTLGYEIDPALFQLLQR